MNNGSGLARAGLLLGALLFLPPAAGLASAEDEKEVPWYESFSGHEMWLTSLDEAIERSNAEKKPLLIDFFSPT